MIKDPSYPVDPWCVRERSMVFQAMETLSPHARNLVDFIREQMSQQSNEVEPAVLEKKFA